MKPFMKILVSLVIFLLPLHLFAQDITGVWLGQLSTSQKQLGYEVVISNVDGKFIGYSFITFPTKDSDEVVAMKSLSVSIKGNVITIEDNDPMFDNFPQAQYRTIKQIGTLTLTVHDTAMQLAGDFKVKHEAGLKPISGKILLRKANLSEKSKLMDKLSEMNYLAMLSFIQLKKQKDKVELLPANDSTAKTSTAKLAPSKAPVQQPIIPPFVPVKKDTQAVAVNKQPDKKVVAPVVVQKQHDVKPAAPVVVNKPVTKPVAVVPKPQPTKVPTPVTKPPVVVPTNNPPVAVNNTPVTTQPVVVQTPKLAVRPKPIADIIPAGSAADISKRQIENIQTLYFKSDSLTLSLYDNGEVDGDTVSVLLNGIVIMGKVGLSTHEVKKIIYTADYGDSLQFVMYAENLGSIPPNTGLLIVQDGKDRYYIRFSGDLQKNAAITLRRKPS